MIITEIEGYLRNSFGQKNESNTCEYFGTITDGKYKLEVLINKKPEENIQIERGTKLELIGDLQENGNFTYLLNYL